VDGHDKQVHEHLQSLINMMQVKQFNKINKILFKNHSVLWCITFSIFSGKRPSAQVK